ncbi:uncharacterized protein LOC108136538 [Drosophila elegans]|uniref:uncharacterized protein LOC108136538 n=1 Tax=Drosophila elegans TaxID=30023 RepID=UPI0007E8A234|nr:uncharacterized protein LOC108136538 [Drosophila elegans]
MLSDQNCFSELKRDLYESWLIVFIGMFVRWNQWRLLTNEPEFGWVLDFKDGAVSTDDDQRWKDLYFGCGVLMAILQYRPLYVRRCRHHVNLLMLLAETWLLLQLVEYLDSRLWLPFLGIIREMLLALGRAEWGSWLVAHLPAVCINWLLSGKAFNSFHLISSFVIFIAAVNSSLKYWQKTVNFLLLGCLPETPALGLFLYEARQQRYISRRTNGLPPDPTPDAMIAKRMCQACQRDINYAMWAQQLANQQDPFRNLTT